MRPYLSFLFCVCPRCIVVLQPAFLSAESALAILRRPWYTVFRFWSGIEVVITGLTRNHVGRHEGLLQRALITLGFLHLLLNGFPCLLSNLLSYFCEAIRALDETAHLETYRRGHNGPDSKSGKPLNRGPWVRIPPSPPHVRLSAIMRKVFFRENQAKKEFQKQLPTAVKAHFALLTDLFCNSVFTEVSYFQTGDHSSG